MGNIISFSRRLCKAVALTKKTGFLVKTGVLFALLLTASTARTQTYPVQAFVQITPPYNSYLPDYADPFNNQMKVLLTLTDFSIPSTQVKLRFEIEGPGYSIQSADLVAFPSITLTPGVPVEISGSDLAPYLSTENLVFSGIDAAAYEVSKVLPEGPATICAEVVNVASAGQPVVGNPACGQTWFSLYDPPLLNLPFCGTELTVTDPQAVLFSWTPLHMASPLSGMTEYVFELYEIRPEMGDPNVVAEASLPIYTEITTNTFVNYSILQPPLQVGMSYVWRVQARDPSGRDLYRNHGFSAVCTFTWGAIAGGLIDGVTLELNSNGTGVRQGLAWWNASDLFDSYVLELRKTGNPGYAWFPYDSEQGTLKVNNLEPSTEYECRVKGIAGGASTDWSNISTFTTQNQAEYTCGSTALPAASPVIRPLDFLMPGNIVALGQFEMVVTSAEPLPLPGHFRGRGKVHVPFIYSNFNVAFEDIYIDEDMVMREGRVDVVTEGVDAWLGGFETIFIPGIINPGGFEFGEDSSVTVYFGDESLEFDFTEADPLVFEDESGLIYTVHSDGRVIISGNITWDDDHLDATINHNITFHKYEDQTYGFDENTYLQWQMHYPCIALDDGGFYFVPYKSVGSGETDIVEAHVTGDIISPTFKYADGTVLSSTKINDTTYHVTVGNTLTSKVIYAYDDLGAKIGKANLSVYADRNYNVVVVPVNGASPPADLQTSINNTFAQANVSFSITVTDNYENDTYDVNANGLESPDATLMQKYSSEMRSLRDTYFEQFEQEDRTYYIFVVPDFDTDLDGYMVRGKSIAFIKSGETARTFAHELGHGAFGLHHTFPAIPVGETNNLLDYTLSGDHLTHEQWYEMQHFTPVFSILDDEEDGSAQNVTPILKFFNDEQVWVEANPDYAVPLLDGTILKINGLEELMFDIHGKVYKFKANGIEHTAYFAESLAEEDRYFLCGYFTDADLDHLRSLSGDAKKESIKERRFINFASTEFETIAFTKSPKIAYGVYTECYCEQYWTVAEETDVDTYISDHENDWYYPERISLAYEKSEPVTYENCTGTCLDFSDYDVEGPAVNLFIELSDEMETDEELSALADMVNHINDLAEGKTFAFYTELEGESYDDKDNWWWADRNEIGENSFTVHFFRDMEIFDMERFEDYFPVVSDGDDEFEVIFSKVDLWAFLGEYPGYNAHSMDYTSFPIPHFKDWEPEDTLPILELMIYIEELYDYQTDLYPDLAAQDNFADILEFIEEVRADPAFWMDHILQLRMNCIACFTFLGVFELYEYQFEDLRTRRIIERSGDATFIDALHSSERQGQANPLGLGTSYDQYIALYDTRSAFYVGFSYMEMYVESIFEPAVLAVVISRMQRVASSFRRFRPSKNLDDIVRISDDIAEGADDLFYKNADELALTYDKGGAVSKELRDEIFDLYKKRRWGELEELFSANELNYGWPPANGGYNVVDNVPIKAGDKFDRYGGSFGIDDTGNPILGGSFTSPIEGGTPYSFGERALNAAEETYDFYYKIEVLEDLPFGSQNGDVIPWFGQAGGGKQAMWDIPANPASPEGHSYTWNELADMGYLKITIVSSPSGNFNHLAGTVISN